LHKEDSLDMMAYKISVRRKNAPASKARTNWDPWDMETFLDWPPSNVHKRQYH